MKQNLTVERLRALISYEPDAGVFRWRTLNHVFVKPGAVCGTPDQTRGYIRIGVDGKIYKAHRLAWFYVHGDWPDGPIDHINGVKDDNSIANLRVITPAINAQNERRPRICNTSGFMGVHQTKSRGKLWKWRARITVNGKRVVIGDFDTSHEAGQAYLVAKRQYHEGCTI